MDNPVWVDCPKCVVCGETASLQVMPADLERYRNGEYVQAAFPEMPAEDREMLISGTHPKCFDTLFAE